MATPRTGPLRRRGPRPRQRKKRPMSHAPGPTECLRLPHQMTCISGRREVFMGRTCRRVTHQNISRNGGMVDVAGRVGVGVAATRQEATRLPQMRLLPERRPFLIRGRGDWVSAISGTLAGERGWRCWRASTGRDGGRRASGGLEGGEPHLQGEGFLSNLHRSSWPQAEFEPDRRSTIGSKGMQPQ